MSIKFYLHLILIVFCGQLFAQLNVDSLDAIIGSDASDIDRAKAALLLSDNFMGKDLDRVYQYARSADALLSDPDTLKVKALDQLARYYFFKSNLDSATFYFSSAQAIAAFIPDPFLEASLGNSIASVLIRQSKFDRALATLISSSEYFESVGDDTNASKCYSNMSAAHAALGNYEQAIKYSKSALDVFRKNGLDQYTLITLPNLATQYLESGDTSQAFLIFHEAEQLAIEKGNQRSLALTYNNLGDLYLTYKQYDKAKLYIEKSIAAKSELNLLKGIDNNYHNLGYIYAQKGDHKRAIKYYNQAIPHADASNRIAIYNRLKESHQKQGNFAVALNYANLSLEYRDSLDQEISTKNFNEISVKYETSKKENEILLLETENQKLELVKNRSRLLMLGALGLAFGLVVLGAVFFHNQRRNRLLAQKEFEISQQKMIDEIQRKELESIDRIVQSQEDERNRISADLHDSLGSKMAALKLYVDELDETNHPSSSSLRQVREIADMAYMEIRDMSYNLNSGVLIDRGLLRAVRKTATFIAETKDIDIEVIAMDIPDRLDNKKELHLFRIIQELLTNIVKHSAAKRVIIQLSSHDNNLSLTVEDDGVGMRNTEPGIGLQNIQRRVTELGGSITINSSLGEGTSIFISMPI